MSTIYALLHTLEAISLCPCQQLLLPLYILSYPYILETYLHFYLFTTSKPGVYILPLFPPPGGGNFFKMIENSLPQASFFFFAIVKFGEGFQEGVGEFFQDLGRIYTPDIFFRRVKFISNLTIVLFKSLNHNHHSHL